MTGLDGSSAKLPLESYILKYYQDVKLLKNLSLMENKRNKK